MNPWLFMFLITMTVLEPIGLAIAAAKVLSDSVRLPSLRVFGLFLLADLVKGSLLFAADVEGWKASPPTPIAVWLHWSGAAVGAAAVWYVLFWIFWRR